VGFPTREQPFSNLQRFRVTMASARRQRLVQGPAAIAAVRQTWAAGGDAALNRVADALGPRRVSWPF
jgi:hypothetical protein